MLKIPLAACLMMISLNACATNTDGISWCDRDSAIMISRDDILTPGTARQILKHNEIGEVICKW